MREFIGLRSKMYSIDTINSEMTKKAKGVKKSVIDRLTINDYRNVLYNDKIIYGTQTVFRSKLHQIYTQALTKIALSGNDDKRYILPDKINSYAWGHYDVGNQLLSTLE